VPPVTASEPQGTRDPIAERRHLFAATQAVLSAHSLPEVLDRIFRSLGEVLHFQAGGVYWRDDAAGMLCPGVMVGEVAEEVTSFAIPLDHGIVGAVARSGRCELVNDAQRDPRAVYPPGVVPGREHLICVPVQADGAPAGVFLVARFDDAPFDDRELELAELFLSHASIAIANARLLARSHAARATAQGALAELEGVLDAVDASVLVYGADGQLRRANRQARARLDRGAGLPGTLADLRKIARASATDPPFDPVEVPARLARGESVEFVITGWGADPAQRVLVHNAPIIDPDGRPAGVVMLARDISELHAAITERARLDGAIKTARLAAHQLNNQLAPVAGYGEILAAEIPGELGELAGRMAQSAHRAAATLARLQRIVRFEEVESAGQTMLDLDAAVEPG
jgi:GAF domain-containing protein